MPAALAALAGVIGWGPSMLAPVQDNALTKCSMGRYGGASAGIEWQGFPKRPGRICTTASGTRYIGWLGW